jgi:hypothetical protein
MESDDCGARISVKGRPHKLIPPKKFSISLGEVYLDADCQLLLRFGPGYLSGPTLVGVKLTKPLDLDYKMAMGERLKIDIGEIAGIAVTKMINDLVNDSTWWLQDPCCYLIPFAPGAGSDMEANNPGRCVGQLEVLVKEARALPAADFRSSDPYVKFAVAKSNPLREFATERIDHELNPVFEHRQWTQLRWNEAETGHLLFEVFDHNRNTSDTILGRAELPINPVVAAAQRDGPGTAYNVIKRLRDCPVPPFSPSATRPVPTHNRCNCNWAQEYCVSVVGLTSDEYPCIWGARMREPVALGENTR